MVRRVCASVSRIVLTAIRDVEEKRVARGSSNVNVHESIGYQLSDRALVKMRIKRAKAKPPNAIDHTVFVENG